MRAPALRCRRRLRRLRRPPCSVSVAGRRVDSRGAGGWKAGGCRMGIRTSTSRPSIPRSPRLFLAPPPHPAAFRWGCYCCRDRAGRGSPGQGRGRGCSSIDRAQWGRGVGGKRRRDWGWGGVSGVAVFFCGCFLWLFPSPVTPLPPSPRRGCLCLFIPTSVYLNKHSRSACLFLRVAGGLYVGSRGRDGV